jgi:hypothetical protein
MWRQTPTAACRRLYRSGCVPRQCQHRARSARTLSARPCKVQVRGRSRSRWTSTTVSSHFSSAVFF